MYRHVLVPIDESDLSLAVVSSGVALAGAVGARVTFLQAAAGDAPDRGAGSAHPGVPTEPANAAAGARHELLAKAQAAARAFGVPCDARVSAAGESAAAISATARERHCDLIVMAWHADRDSPGAALAGQTLSALLSAGLPVLVACAADRSAPAQALGAIRDEHRRVAAVMHAWMDELAAARAVGALPSSARSRTIVRYLQAFVLARQGAQAHLFGRLRKRRPALGAELDELDRQHARNAERVAALTRGVDALAGARGSAAAAALDDLDRAVHSYAVFLWDHLGRAEAVILPAAQRELTAADWSHVDAVLARERDAGAERECGRLFAQIVAAGDDLH